MKDEMSFRLQINNSSYALNDVGARIKISKWVNIEAARYSEYDRENDFDVRFIWYIIKHL